MPSATIVVFQLLLVLASSLAVGTLLKQVHQPQVVSDIITGILLGPTFLGQIAPRFFAAVFPLSSLDYIDSISHVGIIIYMFLVGLSMDTKALRKHGHAALLVSHASITMPFALGVTLAYLLYPRLSNDSVEFSSFALFMGVSMSITAFPVLARLMAERKLCNDKLKVIVLACAAVDDITGWCVLAYIVAAVNSGGQNTSLFYLIMGVAILLVGVLALRRPLQMYLRFFRKESRLSGNLMTSLLLLVFGSAAYSHWLGIHVIFGAFVIGAILPKDDHFVTYITERLQPVTTSCLLPMFFVLTGLRMNLNVMIDTPILWFYFTLILVVACVGKVGGSFLAARMSQLSFSDSITLGVLMNTRGLVELVVLNVGLEMALITPLLFSMMVLMAVTTTLMTTPLLGLIYKRQIGVSAEIA